MLRRGGAGFPALPALPSGLFPKERGGVSPPNGERTCSFPSAGQLSPAASWYLMQRAPRSHDGHGLPWCPGGHLVMDWGSLGWATTGVERQAQCPWGLSGTGPFLLPTPCTLHSCLWRACCPNTQTHMLGAHLLMLASPPAEQTQGHQGCQKQQNPDTQQHGLKANEQGLGTEDRSCRHPSHCCHLRSVSMLIFNAGSLSTFSTPSLQLLRVGAAAEGALCVGSMGLACREHPETSLSLCDRLGL